MTRAAPCFTVFLLILTFVSAMMLPAQEVLLPEEESPSSFYDTDIDSEDVSLFLSGSWKVNLSASAGFGFSPESGFNESLSYPGISSGLTFSQSPDITVSLLILEKILFEAAFTDNFDDSTFRLGYIGDEDEFVRLVSAGNMEINLTEDTGMSDFFYIPGGGPSSFGIHSLFAGPFSEHELLFRFDPQEELHKLYIGSDILVEIVKQPSDYLRGRMFYLPAAPDDAVFYIESGSADASVSFGDLELRALSSEEYSYSSSTGRLLLNESAGGTLLVYNPATEDMLKIWDPGLYSTYEAASIYDLNSVLPNDSWKTRAFLAYDVETASSGIELSAEVLAENGLVIIGPTAGGTLQQPLSGVLGDAASVYGADAASIESGSAQKLVFRIRETAAGYSVDNPVPGSLRIFINGIETQKWSESGGAITFDVPPADSDRIEIIYRKNTGTTGGDLLFASANRFSFAERWSAELNGGIRWNLAESYVLPGSETSAYGVVNAGLSYDSSASENDSPLSIKAGINAGVKLLVENSAGNLLLKDMSGTVLDVPLNKDRVFPASLSEEIAKPANEDLAADERGLLLYKDYRIDAPVTGYFLQDYDTEISADMIFSPEQSSSADRYKAGPYTTSALKDGIAGEVLAMDWVLPSEKSWTSVQIPLNTGADNLDLSGSRSISFDCKTDDDLSSIKLFLEIGSISEDLDGDGVLDAESVEYASGYIFNDPNSAAGTLVGGDNLTGSNGIADTEDFNGSGYLDQEKTDAIALFSDITKPGADWQRMRFYFTDSAVNSNGDDSARSRLKNAEFIRITAVNTSVTEQRGRILFDDFSFEGASFAAADGGSYSEPEYTELLEAYIPAAEQPESLLDSPTRSSESSNRLLRVDWTDAADDWKLSGYTAPVTAADYSGAAFYFHAPVLIESGGEDAVLNFSYTDSDGLGLRAAVPLSAGTDWHKVEIALPADGTAAALTVDGVQPETSVVSYDSNSAELYLIELSTAGTDAGIIYIDEIYLYDPVLKALTGITEHLELSYTDPVLTAGDIELIGPLSFSQSGSALIDADAENISSENADLNLYTEMTTLIAGAPLSADFTISGPDSLFISGGHRLDIPVAQTGLSISDTFHMSNDGDNDFSKSNDIKFAADFLSVETGFSAALDSGQLNRQWSGGIASDTDLFNMGISADLLLSDMNHSIEKSNYFTGWYSGTKLAADFSFADLMQRKTVFGFSADIAGSIIGFSSDTDLTADVTSDEKITNSADINLNIPVAFETELDTFNIEFSYNRRADFTDSTISTSFADDIYVLFSTLGTGGYIYSSIPFYELFNPELPGIVFDSCSSAGIDSSSFSNEARFSLSRNYSSRLLDLLIPYSFETGILRETEKDFTDLEDSFIWDLVWKSAALNLFGSAGVYSFFDFYFSDELNWSVETSVYQPFTSVTAADLRITGGFSIFGQADDIFSIDLSVYQPFNLEAAEPHVKSDFMYVWNVYPEKPFDIPLFTAEEEVFQIIINEEKLLLSFEDVFSTELKHSTTLQLPGRLSLSAFALLGYQYNNLSENKTSLFGFSFGVSGSIIY